MTRKRTAFIVEFHGYEKAKPFHLIMRTGVVGRTYCGSFKTKEAAQNRADDLNYLIAHPTAGQLEDIAAGYDKEH